MSEKKPAISRKLLKMRKSAKRKKPEFLRSESWRYSKMSESWRRPRGLDHKMRRKKKGWPPMVSTGYKGPTVARGLHPSGFREIIVHNVAELDAVNPKIQAVRIAHTVSKKKRTLIVAEAQKKKLKVLNPGLKESTVEAGEDLGEELVEPEDQQRDKPRRRLFGRKKSQSAETKDTATELSESGSEEYNEKQKFAEEEEEQGE